MRKPYFSYRTKKYRRKTNWGTYIGVALLLIGAIVMWWFIFTTIKLSETIGARVYTVLAVENKEVSHYPPIKFKKYVTINIVNSTGNTEHEEEMVKALVKSGYSPANIELKKAKEPGYTGTTITSNADYEAIVANIKDVLKSITPEITDGTPSNDPNVDSGFDVVIITGSRVINTKMPTQGTSLSNGEILP